MLKRALPLLLVALLAGAASPAGAAAATRPLDITSQVRLLDGAGAGGALRQKGTFSGAPLGAGTVTLTTDIGSGRGATFSFEMVNARGRIRGTGDVALTFKGTSIVYRGTAKITSGTGAFRTFRASNLRVDGSGPLSGETFKVRLTGSVTG